MWLLKKRFSSLHTVTNHAPSKTPIQYCTLPLSLSLSPPSPPHSPPRHTLRCGSRRAVTPREWAGALTSRRVACQCRVKLLLSLSTNERQESPTWQGSMISSRTPRNRPNLSAVGVLVCGCVLRVCACVSGGEDTRPEAK